MPINKARTYAVLHLAMYFASGRAEQTTVFPKFLHNMQKFREKDTSVPCCRRRIGLPSGETPGLHVHRVRPESDVQRLIHAALEWSSDNHQPKGDG